MHYSNCLQNDLGWLSIPPLFLVLFHEGFFLKQAFTTQHPKGFGTSSPRSLWVFQHFWEGHARLGKADKDWIKLFSNHKKSREWGHYLFLDPVIN